MSTLIQSYEQQYSILTADITAKIGRLKSATEDEKGNLSREIQSNFEEANDLLEQLELEYRGSGAGSRVGAYRAELQRVRDEYRSAASNSATYNIEPDEYEDWSVVNDQRRKLLDNTERLERCGAALCEGRRALLHTEQLGAAVLRDLHAQRETIQRSRDALRTTDSELDMSSRISRMMVARGLQERAVLGLVLLALAALGGAALYAFAT